MGTSTKSENPYLSARREWMERYGTYVRQLHVMTIVAVLALAVSVLLAIGLWQLKADQRVITYVVETDSHGVVVGTRQVAATAKPEEKHIRAQLVEWLTGARVVYVDQRAIDRSIQGAYAATYPNSQARRQLEEFHRTNSPYTRAGKETVEIEIRSALPLAGDTWRLEWDETVRLRSGKVESVKSWQATVNVKIAEPVSPQQVIANPFGVFVSDFSWAPRL